MAGNPLLSPDLFVGREAELRQLTALLQQGKSTLLIGGRRAGKTTLARQLSSDGLARRLVRTDAAGWDLTTEASALGALRSAVEHRPETTHQQATRSEIVRALDHLRPLALVIDEADRLLQARWGPGFYSFLRWLDDTHLRSDISILLVGGPVLVLFRDPHDKGSPPLNTAEVRYIEPLDVVAVAKLVEIVGGNAVDRVMDLAGGHAWLSTRLLAEVWDGQTLDEAEEIVSDRCLSTFSAWQQQLGTDGMAMIRRFPAAGLPRADIGKPPWSKYRRAARFARCIGVLRIDDGVLRRGPRIFFDWIAQHDLGDAARNIAISYASDD
ncbi:ATP-binding protein [Micromonospora sp. Llam7]|uniref:ATP-binding protein n=1 Tax=Micromonospora tarapacensis TaxID=2835305 RepID=UPI001C831127|nr:ATP-binding protein [Micromonospora tarapacensis]MBX7266550.1 ATP-binding protein [Micromonospora tarapacensis]